MLTNVNEQSSCHIHFYLHTHLYPQIDVFSSKHMEPEEFPFNGH